jgi:hypothetical protein
MFAKLNYKKEKSDGAKIRVKTRSPKKNYLCGMKNTIERFAPRLIVLGLVLELLVLLVAFLESDGAMQSFFQASARLSGRVSVLFFSVLMIYATLVPEFERGTNEFRTKYILFRDFAIVHIIHWFLLAAAVYLSPFELLPIRVMGGAIAYGLVAAMPYLMERASTGQPTLVAVQASYMFWVWIVFTMTYTSRLGGSTSSHTGSPAAWWPIFIWLIGLIFWRSLRLLGAMRVTKK